MAAFGFSPADYGESEFIEVWPENHAAFQLFTRLGTQWRVSMSGCIGLDYSALYPLLDRAASDAQEWDELFEDIQILERAALEAMNEKA